MLDTKTKGIIIIISVVLSIKILGSNDRIEDTGKRRMCKNGALHTSVQ